MAFWTWENLVATRLLLVMSASNWIPLYKTSTKVGIKGMTIDMNLNNLIPREEVIFRPRKVILAFLVWTSYSLKSWSVIDFNACGKDQSKFFMLLSMLFPPKEIIDIICVLNLLLYTRLLKKRTVLYPKNGFFYLLSYTFNVFLYLLSPQFDIFLSFCCSV